MTEAVRQLRKGVGRKMAVHGVCSVSCAYRKLKTAVGDVGRAWWLEGRYGSEIVLQNLRS
jgi:hypothetical protein